MRQTSAHFFPWTNPGGYSGVQRRTGVGVLGRLWPCGKSKLRRLDRAQQNRERHSGSVTYRCNLTVHGVTRPTKWIVSADFTDSVTTGNASTKFTFSDFGLTQPRVPIVLSIADTIGLEYEFKLRNMR